MCFWWKFSVIWCLLRCPSAKGHVELFKSPDTSNQDKRQSELQSWFHWDNKRFFWLMTSLCKVVSQVLHFTTAELAACFNVMLKTNGLTEPPQNGNCNVKKPWFMPASLLSAEVLGTQVWRRHIAVLIHRQTSCSTTAWGTGQSGDDDKWRWRRWAVSAETTTREDTEQRRPKEWQRT